MEEKESTEEETAPSQSELNDRVRAAIEEYQCPGCVCGSNVECFKEGDNLECGKHVVGTTIMGIGRIFLGLPTGFCRQGPVEELKVYIFESPEKGWGYDKFNVPAWKHLDDHGNTLVRGLSPRVNWPFLHVFIGDHMAEIDCLEITKADLSEMD